MPVFHTRELKLRKMKYLKRFAQLLISGNLSFESKQLGISQVELRTPNP